MESSRNTIESNKLSKPDSIDTIKAMLSSHFQLLSQHCIYLAKIQRGSIVDEEVEAYLQDITGESNFDIELFRVHKAPELISNLKRRLDAYIKFIEIFKKYDQEVAIPTLYFQLSLSLEYFRAVANIKSARKIRENFKVFTQSDDIEQVTLLIKKIKKLPFIADGRFDKFISIKRINRKTIINHQTMQEAPEYIFEYDWLSIVKQQKKREASCSRLRSLMMNSQATTSSNVSNAVSNVSNAVVVTIDFDASQDADGEQDLVSKAVNLMSEFRQKMLTVEEMKFLREPSDERLAENIKVYCRVYPVTQELSRVMVKIDKMLDNALAFKNRYKDSLNKIVAKKIFYLENIKLLAKSIDIFSSENTAYQKDFNDLFIRLSKLKSKIGDDFQFVTSGINYDGSDEIIGKQLSVAEEKYKLIKAELQSINADFLKIAEEIEGLKNSTQISAPNISANKKITERERFLAEREKINLEYKEKIAAKRTEKKVQNSIDAVEKAADRVEAVQSITTYKNLDVEEILLSMSDDYFNLLMDLFEFKKGVKYSRVCDLITNQFGGSIEEIGNGSSHKRICLDKYLVDIISSQSSTSVSSSSYQVVGGFYKPHGKAHNSGEMSRFNMELVVNTFIKAGITKELLNQFSDKRNNKVRVDV